MQYKLHHLYLGSRTLIPHWCQPHHAVVKINFCIFTHRSQQDMIHPARRRSKQATPPPAEDSDIRGCRVEGLVLNRSRHYTLSPVLHAPTSQSAPTALASSASCILRHALSTIFLGVSCLSSLQGFARRQQ